MAIFGRLHGVAGSGVLRTIFCWPDISPTGSMVLVMIRSLPRISQIAGQPAGQPTSQIAAYNVYMDNYFSTVGLFKALRDMRCGACGTTRRQGGIPSQLIELKGHIKSIP
jgi:hypothetical protein